MLAAMLTRALPFSQEMRPLDEFGLGTTQYAGFDALAEAILNIK